MLMWCESTLLLQFNLLSSIQWVQVESWPLISPRGSSRGGCGADCVGAGLQSRQATVVVQLLDRLGPGICGAGHSRRVTCQAQRPASPAAQAGFGV